MSDKDLIIEDQQKLIKRIQDALWTAETGEALVEVARNAHRAEMELALYLKWIMTAQSR